MKMPCGELPGGRIAGGVDDVEGGEAVPRAAAGAGAGDRVAGGGHGRGRHAALEGRGLQHGGGVHLDRAAVGRRVDGGRAAVGGVVDRRAGRGAVEVHAQPRAVAARGMRERGRDRLPAGGADCVGGAGHGRLAAGGEGGGVDRRRAAHRDGRAVQRRLLVRRGAVGGVADHAAGLHGRQHDLLRARIAAGRRIEARPRDAVVAAQRVVEALAVGLRAAHRRVGEPAAQHLAGADRRHGELVAAQRGVEDHLRVDLVGAAELVVQDHEVHRRAGLEPHGGGGGGGGSPPVPPITLLPTVAS
jgi:hypothetical protein